MTTATGTGAGAGERDVVSLFLETPSEVTFVPVFHLFAPRLLRFFALRGCDRPLAEDLTQDVMIAAYRGTSTVRDQSSFRAWIYGIARNTHLMHLRREGRNVERVELDGLRETLRAATFDPLSKSVLYESLAFLDAVSRRILQLRYLDGLAYHEIAEVLAMPLGTVQWKVFDSKKKLGKWMSGK